MKNNFHIKLIILVAVLFFSSQNVFAANIGINIDKNILQKDETFVVSIVINTDGESINTVEGDLKYDNSLLKAESVNIGSSFVNFWVEKPDLKTVGLIHFSGITPGGINTPQGEVFKVIFKTTSTGKTNLLLDNVNLFLNDGKGTLATSNIKNLKLEINGTTKEDSKNISTEDKTLPEKFTIIRTKDQSIFDDKYFIVFSTTDKDSGVDHYKVCEFFSCSLGESPYLLKNQTLFYKVVVYAYDVNGNSRLSFIVSPWLIVLIFAIFVVIGAFLVIYRRYFYHHKI